jgi:hypothetical protein
MEDRRIGRVLQQAEKFKRLPQHSMHQRIRKLGKARLKRTFFVALAKAAIRKNEALASPVAVFLTGKFSSPPLKRTDHPELVCVIPGIEDKKLQTVAQRKCIALKYIKDSFPPTLWTHS